MMVWYYTVLVISLSILVIPIVGMSSKIRVRRQTQTTGRIDCYPESEAVYSNFSQATCLARGCLYDSSSVDVPCYLPPNYGYIIQGNEKTTPNGIQLSLTRNSAVMSPFPQPIENVTLDVTYYTNDIIRFKLYDANNSRYEVKLRVIKCPGISSFSLSLGTDSTDSCSQSNHFTSIYIYSFN